MHTSDTDWSYYQRPTCSAPCRSRAGCSKVFKWAQCPPDLIIPNSIFMFQDTYIQSRASLQLGNEIAVSVLIQIF